MTDGPRSASEAVDRLAHLAGMTALPEDRILLALRELLDDAKRLRPCPRKHELIGAIEFEVRSIEAAMVLQSKVKP